MLVSSNLIMRDVTESSFKDNWIYKREATLTNESKLCPVNSLGSPGN